MGGVQQAAEGGGLREAEGEVGTEGIKRREVGEGWEAQDGPPPAAAVPGTARH